jgi:hypothetical protein
LRSIRRGDRQWRISGDHDFHAFADLYNPTIRCRAVGDTYPSNRRPRTAGIEILNAAATVCVLNGILAFAIADRIRIETIAAAQIVSGHSAVEGVVRFSAFQRVRSIPAEQLVLIGFAIDPVGSFTTDQRVAVCASMELVVSLAAFDVIIAGQAGDGVALAPAERTSDADEPEIVFADASLPNTTCLIGAIRRSVGRKSIDAPESRSVNLRETGGRRTVKGCHRAN